jgi:hypothetical protein
MPERASATSKGESMQTVTREAPALQGHLKETSDV